MSLLANIDHLAVAAGIEAVVVDVLDLEDPRQLVAHRGAVVHRDAVRRIDEHPHQPSAGRSLEIDQLIAEAFRGLFDQFQQLHALAHTS